MNEREDNGVLELVARVHRAPDVVAEALARPCEPVRGWQQGSLVITGVGASEAVGRFAGAALRHLTPLAVSEAPLSCFAQPVEGRGRSLLILSQELSPNAHLALARAPAFNGALLVTSVDARDERLAAFVAGGGQVYTVPPGSERGLLVRVMGPLSTALAVLRLGGALAGHEAALPRLPGAMRAALEVGRALGATWPLQVTRAPLLATGWYARCVELLSWTWMETLFVEPPPAWDLLQLAHGPWQQLFDAQGPLLALRRPDDVPGLWSRLDEMVALGGHRLVPLEATLPAPLCFFEHAMLVFGLLCGVLERAPRDLRRWPGFGTDGPLYSVR
jgi:hypothetical protein